MSTSVDLGLPHVHRGKVRDLYDAGDGRLLMVASDRLSAFDVVMAEPVPDKGRVLTAMSAYWFDQVSDVVGNHLISTALADVPESARRPELDGRIMLCRRAEMIPVECIVRAFVAGSAWKEYRTAGTIHGMAAPPGLVQADRLPEPMFTPSTKAAVGDHDENISFDRAVQVLGAEVAEQARDVSLAIFRRAAARRRRRASSWPTPSSSWASSPATTAPVAWCWPTRCSRPIRPATGSPPTGRPDPRRRASTSSRSATTWRRWTGTSGLRRPHCRPRWSGPRPIVTATPTSSSAAAGSPTGRARESRSAGRPVWENHRMIFDAIVEVRLRPGVADPQGATVERALPALGFHGVTGVTVGKSIRFTVDAGDEASARAVVDDLCHRFLTNPVIEDSVVTLTVAETVGA